MTWNPQQYLKFAEPRLRPALELLARIPIAAPRTVCDIGCGAGNVTRYLVERWPGAAITGVDNSATMLAHATATMPQVRWVNRDLSNWHPEVPVDVIYSNAAFHWLPDHQQLFARYAGNVARGGAFAVQMPCNFRAPSHTLIADTVRSGPWRDKLQHLLRPVPVRDPQFYYDVLAPLASEIDIWQTEYLHVLTGPDPVKEWTKGTWLKPFLDALAPSDRDVFEREYASRLREAYPPQSDGTTLFPFKRLFIVAVV